MSLINERTTTLRIVLRKWPILDSLLGASELTNQLGQVEYLELRRIAEVYRASDCVRAPHEATQAVDEVVNVTERSGLCLARAVDRQRFAPERGNNEIGNDAAVFGMHIGTVRIE